MVGKGAVKGRWEWRGEEGGGGGGGSLKGGACSSMTFTLLI